MNTQYYKPLLVDFISLLSFHNFKYVNYRKLDAQRHRRLYSDNTVPTNRACTWR
jgi:hypothetical protein